jgi:hypothetical protein
MSEKEIMDAVEKKLTDEFVSDPDFHLYDNVKVEKK